VAALAVLAARGSKKVFTVREVYVEMLATGTSYAESTVFKTMQRMKEPAVRAPYAQFGAWRNRRVSSAARAEMTPAQPAQIDSFHMLSSGK
jgi:hypothetical protein